MFNSVNKLMQTATLIALTAGAAHAGPQAMTAEEARHLISRTGFGAAPHEVTAMIGMPYTDAVDRILRGMRPEPVLPMPAWTNDWIYPANQIWALGQTQTELFYANRWMDIEQLSGWWMAEMAATTSPMTERMVLFWSNHFANSFDAHEQSQWMAQRNAFFRKHAAGDFQVLLEAVLTEPATLEYLDNVSNLADAPNENLGREFLELFSLGEGRGYDQDDVRAAARMLTGLTVADEGTPVAYLEQEDRDTGPKTIFGKTGRFGAEDLPKLTLQNPAFGPYIVEKLWLEFISDTPDAAEVARLSALWKANDWQIEPLLKAMLLTDAFWAAENKGRLVKSPVDLLIGTIRTFGLSLEDARDIGWMTEELGQMLFQPPNVGGCPQGVEWINDATASGRATALTYLLADAADQASFDTPTMMMGASSATLQATAAPDDLRVGQVFVTYVEERDPGEGYGGMFSLFDVSFGGETWRSINFWLEYMEEEDFTGLYFQTPDCAPGCFASLPRDEDDPNWVAFEPWDDMRDDLPDLSPQDLALLQALGTHLPALILTTENQMPFKGGWDGDEPAAFMPILKAAQVFSDASEDVLGASTGRFISAVSRPNAMGIAGHAEVTSPDDIDAYLEASEATRIVPVHSAVSYASAREWLDALPGGGLESERAAQAVLAVPRASQGQRKEMVASDPDALLRHLILSPAYQVK